MTPTPDDRGDAARDRRRAPPTTTVDGHHRRQGPIEARKGELVIAAAERAGTYIPRFCYHPRMKPVGMCRMCLVEVDSRPRPGPAAVVHDPGAPTA